MTDSSDRILIFGGTFDPPHRAHTELPPLVAREFGCDEILYVPAAINPLKRDTPPTPAVHRLAMLERAVHGIPHARISTIELDRAGPSYTVDTLESLRARYGESVTLFLLIGADQATEFHRWKDWTRILELAEPAVMLRPPWTRQSLERSLRESGHYDDPTIARWLAGTVDVPAVQVSSTDIREALRSGGDLSGMLDDAVVRYIREHGLYAT